MAYQMLPWAESRPKSLVCARNASIICMAWLQCGVANPLSSYPIDHCSHVQRVNYRLNMLSKPASDLHRQARARFLYGSEHS